MIADVNAEAIQFWRKDAEHLPDPIARLRYCVFSSIGTLDGSGDDLDTARFIVSAHWRLHRVLPEELDELPSALFVDRLLAEIKKGQAAGQLTSAADPEVHAWLLAELIRSVYYWLCVSGPALRVRWRRSKKIYGSSASPHLGEISKPTRDGFSHPHGHPGPAEISSGAASSA